MLVGVKPTVNYYWVSISG